EDRVTDHIPLVAAADELLRLIHFEILEAVDRQIGQQSQRVGALDIKVGHVMRLIEQRACLPPRLLLIPPIGELRPYNREGIRPDLRIAEKLHRIADVLQQLFETIVAHNLYSPLGFERKSQVGARNISVRSVQNQAAQPDIE